MMSTFKFAAIVAITALASICSYSQAPLLNETPAQRAARERAAQPEADLSRRMNDMRALESSMKNMPEREFSSIIKPQLDQKTRERVRQSRKVNPEDTEKYKKLVAKDGTGIFRLFPNFDCDTQTLIRVDGECTGFVPESSDFSFRAKMYSDPKYHDIGFEHDQLVSDAFFSQGILVSLGDVPLDKVTLTDAGLSFLTHFQTAASPAEAKNVAAKLKEGVNAGEFTYSSHVKANDNTTYALRMIAYQFGNSLPPPSPRSTMLELKFLSLSYDERYDTVVAFRIVRREQDGSVTIIWKELGRRDAPKLKFAKGEEPYDFKQ